MRFLDAELRPIALREGVMCTVIAAVVTALVAALRVNPTLLPVTFACVMLGSLSATAGMTPRATPKAYFTLNLSGTLLIGLVSSAVAASLS